MFSDIISVDDIPLNFLEVNYVDDKRKDLMDAVDLVNHRMGRDAVFYASSGINKEWEMKRAKLSPGYTTRWSDLPKAK